MSDICLDLVEADAVRRLITNLNQTGILGDVIKKHSETRSVGHSIGCCGSVSVGGIWTLTGWGLGAVVLIGSITAAYTGKRSWDHKTSRDRIRKTR
jgi:hypothetical protein